MLPNVYKGLGVKWGTNKCKGDEDLVANIII